MQTFGDGQVTKNPEASAFRVEPFTPQTLNRVQADFQTSNS